MGSLKPSNMLAPMVIIDAFNVKTGGALVLLEYLVMRLHALNIGIAILANVNNGLNLSECENTAYVTSKSFISREIILKKWCKKFQPTAVLCFGNFAPLLKLPINTYVYFHNTHLTSWQSNEPLFKKAYLKLGQRNATAFLFQTETTRNIFCHFFSFPASKTKILPFYNNVYLNEAKRSGQPSQTPSFVYNSLPYRHKNHKYLFRVWAMLAERGLFPDLHVTVPADFKREDLAVPELPNVHNHGYVPYEELLSLMSGCSHCIYPSNTESYGLGLVEAAELNLKVIAADLPYTFEVIKPSAVFSLENPPELVMIISGIMNGTVLAETQLVSKNRIENVLQLLTGV